MIPILVEFYESGEALSTQDFEHEGEAYAEAGMWTEGNSAREAVVHARGHDVLVLDGAPYCNMP